MGSQGSRGCKGCKGCKGDNINIFYSRFFKHAKYVNPEALYWIPYIIRILKTKVNFGDIIFDTLPHDLHPAVRHRRAGVQGGGVPRDDGAGGAPVGGPQEGPRRGQGADRGPGPDPPLKMEGGGRVSVDVWGCGRVVGCGLKAILDTGSQKLKVTPHPPSVCHYMVGNKQNPLV